MAAWSPLPRTRRATVAFSVFVPGDASDETPLLCRRSPTFAECLMEFHAEAIFWGHFEGTPRATRHLWASETRLWEKVSSNLASLGHLGGHFGRDASGECHFVAVDPRYLENASIALCLGHFGGMPRTKRHFEAAEPRLLEQRLMLAATDIKVIKLMYVCVCVSYFFGGKHRSLASQTHCRCPPCLHT